MGLDGLLTACCCDPYLPLQGELEFFGSMNVHRLFLYQNNITHPLVVIAHKKIIFNDNDKTVSITGLL